MMLAECKHNAKIRPNLNQLYASMLCQERPEICRLSSQTQKAAGHGKQAT